MQSARALALVQNSICEASDCCTHEQLYLTVEDFLVISTLRREPMFTQEEIQKKIASVPFWFHQIEVAPGIITPGVDRTPEKAKWIQLPDDLSGKRVLDIGTYDGYFAFECEKRGAVVLAIDTIPYGVAGFKVVKEILDSKVEFRNASVYDLNPNDFGEFDLVLYLGVLYHLRDPLLSLDKIRSVCRGKLILESQICDRWFIDENGKPIDLTAKYPELANLPIAQFYPGAELNNDPSNWWSPNLIALKGMVSTSGFSIEKVIENGVRACLHCQAV